MIKGVFAIKDTKSEFWSPFAHFNEQTAQREFALMVNSIDNPVAQNPADYELWQVGSYDTTTGVIEPLLLFVCNGFSVKKVSE